MRRMIFWDFSENPRNDLKKGALAYDPQRVMLELTSNCNLRCWHCFRSHRDEKGRDAPRELVDYVLDRVLPHAKYLRIGGNGLGEMLVSRHFDYFLSRLDKKNLDEVHLVTNLTVLNEERARLIFEKVDNIDISLEGVGESYTRTRGFPWEKLLKNLEMLARAKRSAGRDTLQINLIACAFLSNLDDLLKVFELKSYGVDRVIFRDLYPPTKEISRECLWNDVKKTNIYIKKFEQRASETGVACWICFKDQYSLRGRIQKAIRWWPVTCYFPWDCLSIMSDGHVAVCCSELTRLGRIVDYNKDILEVLNEEAFVRFREGVNRFVPLPQCRYCEYRDPFWAKKFYKSDHGRPLPASGTRHR